MKSFVDRVRRLLWGLLFVAFAIGICWRALEYSSPRDPSMLAPSVGVTGVALLLRSSDPEDGEQRPAGQN